VSANPSRNLSAVKPEVTQNPVLGADDRLLRLVVAYLPIAAGGAVLSFVYDVGAHPGGDPAEDIFLRGTPLVPPLFLPAGLVAGSPYQEGRHRGDNGRSDRRHRRGGVSGRNHLEPPQ